MNQHRKEWSLYEIHAVWNKGIIVPDYDENYYRKDCCGAWIALEAYGKTTDSHYGWEIDHIKPINKGGSNHISNLQPLQWQNNRAKGDEYPYWLNTCTIKN